MATSDRISWWPVDAASLLRTARARAGLSQRALAEAAGTSQPAVAAIESGRKQPTVATLERLLRAAGTELVPAPPEEAALLRRARRLEDVLHLAEALPFRRDSGLRFPRLPS
jgi:transcriptional regulator with XRE-family HTH domain